MGRGQDFTTLNQGIKQLMIRRTMRYPDYKNQKNGKWKSPFINPGGDGERQDDQQQGDAAHVKDLGQFEHAWVDNRCF